MCWPSLNVGDIDTDNDANTPYISGQNGALEDGLNVDHKLMSTKMTILMNLRIKLVKQTNLNLAKRMLQFILLPIFWISVYRMPAEKI